MGEHMDLNEIAKKLNMKQANLSLYGKDLEQAGHVFRKGMNGKKAYTETEFRMIQKMRGLMIRGRRRSEAAIEVVKEWQGSKEPTEHIEEKEQKNRDLQQEILEELKEIKKMMNEMYINQQKKGFINLTFCKKTKK
ncbi:hypothetical protein AT258_18770 [Bacillus wiedmannii]|uniref:hypothetical protein n=1 Tax=Bacillus TaxID=1386 RepID=UPI00077AF734|nr:hypothetical protein [Bacillus cereus]KXY71943.1 hypothetical protein AT258_18770 [Bacillus wiedmannii]MBL3852752.1 hypothetical protein [Bacillus cereus]HDR4563377.1 hypothetical protein [Bacillus luti]HDR4564072.1 hypothetical protein [Bacillus luti]